MESNRVFSEKEAAEILQRAARLQESSGSSVYAAGITLDELHRIASEAGIDPTYIKKALDGPKQTTTRILNVVEETERVIDGELRPDAMDEFAEIIAKYGRVQQATQIGRTFSGYITGGTLYAKVDLTSRNGRTRLKVKSLPLMAYLIGLHIPLILGIALGASSMGRLGSTAGLAIMAGFFAVGAVLFTLLAKVGIERSRKLADEIEEALTGVLSHSSHQAPALQQDSAELQQRLSQS